MKIELGKMAVNYRSVGAGRRALILAAVPFRICLIEAAGGTTPLMRS